MIGPNRLKHLKGIAAGLTSEEFAVVINHWNGEFIVHRGLASDGIQCLQAEFDGAHSNGHAIQLNITDTKEESK